MVYALSVTPNINTVVANDNKLCLKTRMVYFYNRSNN